MGGGGGHLNVAVNVSCSIIIFRRERSDDRKYVCCSQATLVAYFTENIVICRLSLIVRVNVVLNRTVVVDSD